MERDTQPSAPGDRAEDEAPRPEMPSGAGARRGLAKALPLQAKLLEIVPAGVYTCDPDGLVTYFNRRAVEIWGREPALNDPEDRFCGSFRLYSADGSPISHEESWMALALSEERPYENREIIIERRDGERVTVLAHAHPFHDDSGELAGAVNVLVDITERKAAERAKARLAAIVDSADDAIVSKTLDGIITSWNSGAEEIFGYTAEEAIGQHITMIFPPELEDEEEYILERLRRGEMIDHYETVRCHKDGTRLDISVTISPIRDSRGRIVGASKVARDITERKRAEEALREADRRKDEFLAMLSHELRNPLAPIRSAVEILWGEDAGDSSRRKALDALDRQVGTLTRLVDDLLDVTRVTTGTVELQREEVELNGIVRDAVEAVRPQMDERRHRLTLSLAREPLWLYGDATRLEQVIVNLLTNAAKYTPVGGHVTVTLGEDGGDGRDRNGAGWAVLRVEDDGVGMEPDLLSRVFELFGQGESTPDRSDRGLGIGLSLVKRLVEMHGGTVAAASEGRGEGSEFTVRLPLHSSSGDAAPAGARRDEGRGVTGGEDTPSLRVLVVDDHPDTVDMLTTLLRWKDHEVRTAADGLEALRVADDFDPDVVFLDIGLPELDGYEVARRLREGAEAARSFVLVALTGYGLENDRQRALSAGFDHHLVKPTNFEDLQAILERVREGTPAD